MNRIVEVAESMQEKAWRIIKDTKIIEIWSAIGATVNLVGSLKTELLVKNRDVDFHIYTDPFDLTESFRAISQLAGDQRIKKISYTNLLEAEDRCIEWHASYEDTDGDAWQIDMIHILNDSPYAGYFEKVAERIAAVLTPETKEAILTIKNAIPAERKVMSILVYKAVLESGIRDIDSFWQWKDKNPDEGIVTWMP